MSIESYSEYPDEKLMIMYQNGNELAFKILYDRHSSKIYGYLKRRLKNDQLVAEIYQDVFIKIHQAKEQYDPKLPLLPWIFTVTRTVMIDQLRKDKTLNVVELSAFTNETTTQGTESPIDLAHQIKKLPLVQQQALEMRYLQESSFEQIAKALNIQPSNARKMISRGLQRLRELVKEGR